MQTRAIDGPYRAVRPQRRCCPAIDVQSDGFARVGPFICGRARIVPHTRQKAVLAGSCYHDATTLNTIDIVCRDHSAGGKRCPVQGGCSTVEIDPLRDACRDRRPGRSRGVCGRCRSSAQLHVLQIAVAGPGGRVWPLRGRRDAVDGEVNTVAGHRALIGWRLRIIPVTWQQAVGARLADRDATADDPGRIVSDDHCTYGHRCAVECRIGAVEVDPFIGRRYPLGYYQLG